MNAYPKITMITSLIGDPTRAAMLDALMGGHALPAGELAYIARVTPQTASSHLSKLMKGNLIAVEQHGRHRYYRLASQEVAELMEMISAMSPPVQIRSLRQSQEMEKVRHARTCYDHLAGKLGVALTQALIAKGYVAIRSETEFDITEQGDEHFQSIGLDLTTMKVNRRSFAKRCLDWSERVHHIGGFLGAVITKHLFELKWIVRMDSGSRAVRLTEEGRAKLHALYGITIEDLG
ncbi:ArsR/SmtB family transcription factor [Paenibacillus guangzhouensis]|uniref:ArsR/SmtB family transcription factor n=1 Tax=Paenibacillus guangzhouensis TaxID=1473112 RepID=UPI00126743D1|nr:winged helix-turn-helix domain-containing protein [Paenibacillus guangzhouensis]